MPTKEQLFGEKDFAILCEQSLANERLRQHLNIHTDYSDPCQRLVIAMQPRSFVVPHRHTSPPKSETFIVLRGTIGLLFFDDLGSIRNTYILGPQTHGQVCDISQGTWHTAISLEKNTVFMEVKPGPYCPILPVDVAPWSPVGAIDIESYLDKLYLHCERIQQSMVSD